MKVLIIGSNGREHTLAEIYAKSKKIKNVFIAPGNGLTDFTNKKIENVDIEMTDVDKLLQFVKRKKIDLVDVAQDDIIAAGYVDAFEKEDIPTFGPTQKASQIEWDKDWARSFMQKYKLPIPECHSFSDVKKSTDFINKNKEQLLYVKASGLAGGKGAIRTENKQQAVDAINSMKQFGKAGSVFLIEEGLIGEEFSLFAICDGTDYVIAGIAQDHKTAYNKDQGPNTGGMGCVSPTTALTSSMIRIIELTILKPFLKGMEREERIYKGILYLGGIITKNGIKVIEFNARWGDPEAEVILPSIQTDYVDIVKAVLSKKLNKIKIRLDKKIRISIAGCSAGYPDNYSKVKGKEIFGLTDAMKLPGIHIYGAGLKRKNKRFFVDGGRLFHLVAKGKDIIDARKKAYLAMSMIYIEGNNLHFRTDIGWRDVERTY